MKLPSIAQSHALLRSKKLRFGNETVEKMLRKIWVFCRR